MGWGGEGEMGRRTGERVSAVAGVTIFPQSVERMKSRYLRGVFARFMPSLRATIKVEEHEIADTIGCGD